MAFSFGKMMSGIKTNPAAQAFKDASGLDKIGMLGAALGDDPTALMGMIRGAQPGSIQQSLGLPQSLGVPLRPPGPTMEEASLEVLQPLQPVRRGGAMAGNGVSVGRPFTFGRR